STTVMFFVGETNKTVQLPVINNNLPQGDRTVTIALSSPTEALLNSPSNAVLTIKDTVIAPGEIRFSSTSFNASENDASAIITVVRTNGSSGSVSVNYT